MKPLLWYEKVIAIALSLGAYYLWFRDITLHGSFRQLALFLALWIPPLLLMVWSLLFWNTPHSVTQNTRNFVRWLLVRGTPPACLIAGLTYIMGDQFELGLPVVGIIAIEILHALYVILLFPMLSIFLPLFVLDFWKGERNRPIVFALTVIAFVISAFLASSYAQESIASYRDPCYEVVEGKTGTYILKEGLVCVLRSTSAHGTSVFETLQGADAASFEVVGYGYGKDVQRVYYGAEAMASLDPLTFRQIGGNYYSDKTYVLYGKIVLIDADPNTFTDLPGNYYAKDARHAYYNDVVLEGVDTPSFQAIESNEYAWDDNHVYYAGRMIDGADPKSFRFLKSDSFYSYAFDADQVFAYDTWLKNLDVKTFERVSDSDYLRDVDSLYYLDREIIGINARKFRVAPVYREAEHENESPFYSTNDCGTDDTVVICHGEIVNGANPETYFQMTEEQKNQMDSFSKWFDETTK